MGISQSSFEQPCPVCGAAVTIHEFQDDTPGFREHSFTPHIKCGHNLTLRRPEPDRIVLEISE